MTAEQIAARLQIAVNPVAGGTGISFRVNINMTGNDDLDTITMPDANMISRILKKRLPNLMSVDPSSRKAKADDTAEPQPEEPPAAPKPSGLVKPALKKAKRG